MIKGGILGQNVKYNLDIVIVSTCTLLSRVYWMPTTTQLVQWSFMDQLTSLQ